MPSPWSEQWKQWAGPRWTVRARVLLRGKEWPRWGNLRRTTPFSTMFGVDRGTPVDRYYLEGFLRSNQQHITGDVIEIQSASYTERFGTDFRVAHSIDIRPDFNPTYVCDLSACDDAVPSDRYDCFLLPNTVQHLRDVEPALRHALRIVKPGGVVLASAAGFIPLIPDGPDYWRITADGWRVVAARVWPGCDIVIESHGNCLSAIAALHGLAAEELTTLELDVNDRRYPVLMTIRCTKPNGRTPS
jgi:SAM-dependent methyltransferase